MFGSSLTILGIGRQKCVLAIPQHKGQGGKDGSIQHPQHGQHECPVDGAVSWGEATHSLPTQGPHLRTVPGVREQHAGQRQAEPWDRPREDERGGLVSLELRGLGFHRVYVMD